MPLRRPARIAALAPALAIPMLVLWPALVRADSRFETGTTTPSKASAHLDFTIIVPNVAFLRLGTGALSSGQRPSVTLTSVGAAGETQVVNDDAGSLLSARVLGNAGSLSLSARAFGSGWSRFSVTTGSGTAPGTLAHPPLVDGDIMARALPVTRGRITEMDANWIYSLTPPDLRKRGAIGPAPLQPTRLIYLLSMP